MVPLLSHCDCCGLPIDREAGEDCPRCKYPITIDKEERFLETAVGDLQRVTDYGESTLTVSGLLRRYRTRLAYLGQLRVTAIQAAAAQEQKQFGTIAVPQAVPLQTKPSEAIPLHPSVPLANKATEPSPYEDVPTLYVPPPVTPPDRLATHATAVSLRKEAHGNPFAPSQRQSTEDQQPVVVMQAQQSSPRHTFSFSWKAFVLDQAITLIGLLGAFLILMGALSSVVTQSSNRLLSFFIVFGVHAFFGIAGVIAYRFANFRLIARIYTGIYTLLVPLVGFTAYSLIAGSYVSLSVPMLIAIAGVYASIVYLALAIYERFPLFAYLGMMALVVTDLALARSLALGYWWWPSMLMLLALPSLLVLVPGTNSGRTKFFAGPLNILRDPIRILMYTLIGICTLALVCALPYSFSLDVPAARVREVRFSLLSMSFLLLLWTSLAVWLTKRTQYLIILAFLLLACVLAADYALAFSQGGYVLSLAGVALLYHGLHRFGKHLLQSFRQLGLHLDLITLLLIALLPFIGFPFLPLQLLAQADQAAQLATPVLPSVVSGNALAGLIAVAVGCLISVSIALLYTDMRNAPAAHRGWSWLLLLSGFLLNYAYGSIVLTLNGTPVWHFLGLTLALVIAAVLVRQRYGAMWANPLDIIALGDMLVTLRLSLNSTDVIATLFLLFAALTYGVLLYQRRAILLFLPFLFALLALFQLLVVRNDEVLLMGLLLPFVAVAVHHLMSHTTQAVDVRMSSMLAKWTLKWEWPLLAFGLLCGITVSLYDLIFSTSTVHNWLGLSFPVAVEMATFAGVWYMAAALARSKGWLIPAIGFAVGTLLMPTNPFWVLVGVTFVAATLAIGISRFTNRIWASPFYIVALLSAVMAGSIGWPEGSFTAMVVSWLLLTFGLLAYVIGLIEGIEVCLWLLPTFAVWGLIDAARLGDLYRPPVVALVFAGAGVAIGLLNFVQLLLLGEIQKNAFLRYALPFYTTAFAAALLTGVYGMLPGATAPFYGAIPDALLIYALVAFGVVLFERQPAWLWLVTGFASWAVLLSAQLDIFSVISIGLGAAIIGLLFSKLLRQSATFLSASASQTVQFSWGWPWYLTSLLAAIVVGLWPLLNPGTGMVSVVEYALLLFAMLAYVIGVAEQFVPALWIGSLLTIWSLANFASDHNFYRLLLLALVYTVLGVIASSLKLVSQGRIVQRCALPFYMTALVAAVLSGYDATFFGIGHLFYSFVPDALPLLVYAGITYGVLIFERQPKRLALVAGFGIWGVLLAARLESVWLASIGVGTALLGLLMGRILPLVVGNSTAPASLSAFRKVTWSWPWYVIALVAAIMTGGVTTVSVSAWVLLVFTVLVYVIGVVEELPVVLWLAPLFTTWALSNFAHLHQFYPLPTIALLCAILGVATVLLPHVAPDFLGLSQQKLRLGYALPLYVTALLAAFLTGAFFGSPIENPFYGILPAVLLVYALVAFVIMLVERQPELLVLPVGFAACAIGQGVSHGDVASLMMVYSVLCVLTFATQFVWKIVPPVLRKIPAARFHEVIGIGGQLLVVLLIIANGGLAVDAGRLAFVGAGALFVLALLICWYGFLQPQGTIRRYSYYGAGLLTALSICWTLNALHLTNLDLLMLAPATYLIVVAPLLMRDETLPFYRALGQAAAVLGAILLLLPTLWLSLANSDSNLLYTLILMGEALVLLLGGIGARIRVFVLSGTGLMLTGAIHALFLTTSGIPTPLVLTVGGMLLLAIATLLHLLRRRFKAAWVQWD